DLERVATPYSSRTATSRPFESAPRKKRECQVGPIGSPIALTTSLTLPPTLIVSVMWLSLGPVCAMSCAYTGASRHSRRISKNSPPNASATRLRRSRRQASWYGPTPAASLPDSPSSSTGISLESSVPVALVPLSIAMPTPAYAQASEGRGNRAPLRFHALVSSYFSLNVSQSQPKTVCSTAALKSSRFEASLGNDA